MKIGAVNLHLNWQLIASDPTLVATCDRLGVSAQGEDLSELYASIVEIHHLLCKDLRSEEDWKAYFVARGFEQWTPALPDEADYYHISFALHLQPPPEKPKYPPDWWTLPEMAWIPIETLEKITQQFQRSGSFIEGHQWAHLVGREDAEKAIRAFESAGLGVAYRTFYHNCDLDLCFDTQPLAEPLKIPSHCDLCDEGYEEEESIREEDVHFDLAFHWTKAD